METNSNFTVRKSGKYENCYYIDYSGKYKVNDIAQAVGLDPAYIIEVYNGKGANPDNELSVYYFASEKKALEAVKALVKKSGARSMERVISLTDSEIEYIRQALINEGNNMLFINSKVKDSIFKKLNG
jgi:hypothetical protein